MLKVILYDNAKDLNRLDFLQNPKFPLTYIFPNPALTDDFRNWFNEQGVLGDREIITISNFIKAELKTNESFAANFKGKSQLIPYLLPDFKKHIEKPTFEKFLHTFNLLTDMRSFTLNFDLVEDILCEFDVELAKGLYIFWKVLENNELIDEHKSYHLISEKYNIGDNVDKKKNLVFSGFGHLSAMQVEMIQSLGTYHDVYIPFPKNAFKKAHSTDWINWIDTTLALKETEEKKRELLGSISLFPKNKMSEYLQEKLTLKKAPLDFYLMSKDITLEDINEIPHAGINFKVKNDLFSLKTKSIFLKIKNENSWPLEKDKLLSVLEEYINTEKAQNFKQKDFRSLKVYLLIQDVLSSGPFELLSLFDLRVVEYLVELSSPRTFSAPLLEGESKGQIRGIDRLGVHSDGSFKVICVNSNYTSIKTSGSRYPEKVEEFLRALGPIQSNYMEYLQIKEHILEILEQENSLFFLEEGLQKSDLAWEEIFSEFKGEEDAHVEEKEFPQKKDLVVSFINQKKYLLKSISATKLQSYVDCPRKYYFSYCEKIDLFIESKATFSPRDLGLIEHKVIETYLKEFNTWDQVSHLEIVGRVFSNYLLNMNVSIIGQKSALVEIRDYSQHGIQEILKILKIFPDAKLEFEKALPDKGRIDLYFESANGIGVIDFKRSKSSIPSVKDLISFHKVQLWFYLHHLKSEKDVLFLGYLNLARPNDSLFLLKDESIKESLKGEDFCLNKGLSVLKRPMDEMLTSYIEFEEKEINKIKEDQTFNADPINSKACSFCSISPICPREII